MKTADLIYTHHDFLISKLLELEQIVTSALLFWRIFKESTSEVSDFSIFWCQIQYLSLWFHLENIFCRFDARGRYVGKELHWSEERSLGPRAYFVTHSRPASLQLDNVQLQDEDTYRCRVDYKNAPTRNFRIHLTVIGKDMKLLYSLPSLYQVRHSSPSVKRSGLQ